MGELARAIQELLQAAKAAQALRQIGKAALATDNEYRSYSDEAARMLEDSLLSEEQIELLNSLPPATRIELTKEQVERCTIVSQHDIWTEEPTGPDIGYMLRTSTSNSRGFGGSQWPTSGYVSSNRDDFRRKSENSYLSHDVISGLYGLLDGIGGWHCLMSYPHSIWQIFAVRYSECSPCLYEWAHRAPRGWVVYSGDPVGAMRFIIPKMMASPRLHEMIAAHAPKSEESSNV